MLKIRLQRVGRKHEPSFRLVLTDSKNSTKSGKSLEVLGSYDSRQAEKAVVNGEKVNYWLSKGAQASDTAHNLFVRMGIITGEKRNVLPKMVIEKAKIKPEPEPVAEPSPALAATESESPTEGVGAEVEPAEVKVETLEEQPKEPEPAPEVEEKPTA